MEYKIETKVFKEGIIEQTLLTNDTLTDHTRKLTMWICDTREKDIKDSLVKLGWTPPKD